MALWRVKMALKRLKIIVINTHIMYIFSKDITDIF